METFGKQKVPRRGFEGGEMELVCDNKCIVKLVLQLLALLGRPSYLRPGSQKDAGTQKLRYLVDSNQGWFPSALANFTESLRPDNMITW